MGLNPALRAAHRAAIAGAGVGSTAGRLPVSQSPGLPVSGAPALRGSGAPGHRRLGTPGATAAVPQRHRFPRPPGGARDRQRLLTKPYSPITIGKVTLQGGQVTFSDRSIQPPYTAEITDLSGSVSGLSSVAGTTADVDVHGSINRSGALTVADAFGLLPMPTSEGTPKGLPSPSGKSVSTQE